MHREKMINWKLIELIKSKSLPGTNKNQAPHHVIKRHIYIEETGGGCNPSFENWGAVYFQ